jgi:hypothetical protein
VSGGDARRWAAVTAVAGPLLFLVDNLLHPREYALGHEAAQLATIAHATSRWQLAHAFGAGTIAVGAVFILALCLATRGAAPRASAAGAALALIGLCANAYDLALDGYAWGRLGAVARSPSSDPATLRAALGAIQDSGWLTPYHAAAGLVAIGLALLLWSALRGGLVRTYAVVVYLISMAVIGLEAMIHSNAFFIASAALYLVAGLVLAAELTRARSAELA